MTPGPNLIRKCSTCGQQIKQDTIGSGNTCGARFWSDGKRDAPMLPDQPWLVKRPHCSSAVWIDELEELAETEPWGTVTNEFPNAADYEAFSLDEYLTVLEKGVNDPEKERYLRLRTWWSGNDLRREDPQARPMTPREIDNLLAFVSIMDMANDNDLLMKAEMMRELGMFDQSLALLSGVTDRDYGEAVQFIRKLAERRDACVREMRFD